LTSVCFVDETKHRSSILELRKTSRLWSLMRPAICESSRSTRLGCNGSTRAQ